MAKSQIILLLLILNPLNAGLDHLSQEAVFPFKLRYHEICEPTTISSSLNYNEHYVFQQFFLALNDKNELQIPEILKNFADHKKVILKYVQDLDQYSQDFLNEESLLENSQAYYRKKLHYLGQKIYKNMNYQPNQYQKVFQTPHPVGINDEYLTSNFQPFFEDKFSKITNLDFFYSEARDFARSEMDLGKDYFKEELCGIKRLLFQVIEYYTQPPTNMSGTHLYQGEIIPLENKKDLVEFFHTYHQLDTDQFNCYNKPSDRVELIKLILGLIFDPEEVDILLGKKPEEFTPETLDEITALKPKRFGPLHISKIYDPKEKSQPGKIVDRDIYLLEFPDRLQDLDLDLDRLGEIKNKKIHFSPQFMRFLDEDLPKEIEELQNNGDLPKNLTPVDFPDMLYPIYVDFRQIEEIPENFPHDVPSILKVLLKKIKEDFYSPERNPIENKEQPLIADHPKIRKRLPAIVQYLKKKLKISDDEEGIPDEQVADKIFKYGGDVALNDLIDDYKPIYSPEVIKNAGEKLIDSTLESLNLKKDIFPPLKNIDDEDEPKGSRPIIENGDEDEDYNEKPQVIEVRKKIKRTVNKLMPTDVKIQDNQIDFFAEQLFEKIDTEDPVVNDGWTQIIIRIIEDKEGELDEKIKKNFKNLFSKKLLKKIEAKVFNVPGFIKFMKYQVNQGKDIDMQNIFPNSSRFTFPNKKLQLMHERQVKTSYAMFLSDIAIFYLFVSKQERLKEQNSQRFFDNEGMNLLQRAGLKTFDSYIDKIQSSNLILAQYHGISFFFEFIRVFHLFDSEQFDKSEVSQQSIGTIFWKIYKFVMLLRLRVKKDIANPISYALKNIRRCAEQTYTREGEEHFGRKEALCQEDYSDYINMELFIKYYIVQQNPTEKNHKNFFNFDLKAFEGTNQKFMIVESSTFHKFMDNVKSTNFDMSALCKGYETQDLCVENFMRKEFNLILENNPVEWKLIEEKILVPYAEILKDRKYLFWNLMEIIERIDNFKFEQFLQRVDDDGLESEDNKNLVKYLYIQESEVETWVAEYLRLNFAHYSLHLQNLSNTVDYIMTNNMTEQYLTHDTKFTYNNQHDVLRQFHFANVRLFLYLAHKKTNYAKLAHLLKNHTWMVILFKRMVDKDQDQHIKDISEHIKSGGSPKENAQKVLELINTKHDELKPNHNMDFDELVDDYNFLDEEFDVENLANDFDSMSLDDKEIKDDSELGDFIQFDNQDFVTEIEIPQESNKGRKTARKTEKKVYGDAINFDKATVIKGFERVFKHLKLKTGKEQIFKADMEHVNVALSTMDNLKLRVTMKQIIEDNLKAGNTFSFQNIDLSKYEKDEQVDKKNKLLI